jgi:polysaccharide export outer membrane protein
MLASLAASLLVAGCAGTRGGPIAYNQELAEPDAPQVLTLAEDYRISPLDTLRVNVFQVPDLSGEFEVDLTGHIALPLLGNVKAVDMTTAQLDQMLTQRLGAKYLQSPDVAVGVKSSARRALTIDGNVRNPGLFPVNGPMTLVQAVALAKGTDENANLRALPFSARSRASGKLPRLTWSAFAAAKWKTRRSTRAISSSSMATAFVRSSGKS